MLKKRQLFIPEKQKLLTCWLLIDSDLEGVAAIVDGRYMGN